MPARRAVRPLVGALPQPFFRAHPSSRTDCDRLHRRPAGQRVFVLHQPPTDVRLTGSINHGPHSREWIHLPVHLC